MTSAPIKVLGNRYRLNGRLGKGAMGSVWQAHDLILGRTVAVKQLTAGWHDGEDLAVRRERVRREAIALARVEHPVVVSIHDLIYDGNDPWIVMGYVRGLTLDQTIQQRSPLDEQEVASIGLAVLYGLTACHAKDVYHRDVKPANIIKCDDGTVQLVDFGIAQIADLDPLTDDSKILGTLEFLDPELFRGKQASPATDLWALGITLYLALEGRSPFRGATMEATVAAILSKNPPEPRSQGALAGLTLRMLDKHPANRPSPAAVLAVLQGVVTGRSLPSAPRSAHYPDDRRTEPMPRRESPARPAEPVMLPRQQLRHAGSVPSASLRRGVRPLSGLPVSEAAAAVARWATDQAVAHLLATADQEAAKIILRCGDSDAGRLLSAIATEKPAQARKFLDMTTADRRGRLLNHMSSSAAASALVVPPHTAAARALANAYDTTVAGALSEMNPASAALLVTALVAEDEGRVAAVLGQAAPATVAAILKNMVPPAAGRHLLRRLPVRFQELVAKRAAAAG